MLQNLDALKNSAEIKAKFIEVMNDETKSNEEIVNALELFSDAKFAEYSAEMEIANNDSNVLVGRGVRQLTSAEKKYYNHVIDAMKSNMAIDNSTVPMPTTIFEAVFEDLRQEHPLLSEIDMVNTTGLTEYIMRNGDVEAAFWGELCEEIKKELAAAFKKIQVAQFKLSAFLPVCKSMIVLGPKWLDRFVRDVLTESSELGLEKAVITGTGKNEPIGMDRDLAGAVVEGVYPKKAKVSVTELTPVGFASFMPTLSNNGKRAVGTLLLVVNPIDYYTIIMPALLQQVNGKYETVSPYPVKVITSQYVAQNRAIAGIGEKYFLGVGSNQAIEYSDHYHFLEDERVYITKLLANGMPKDNNAFVYLDITNLKPAVFNVNVLSMPEAGEEEI